MTDGWREKRDVRDDARRRAPAFNTPRTYRPDAGQRVGDRNSNPGIRRMDSFARLLHIPGTVTTAVGLDERGVLQIGVNRIFHEDPREHARIINDRLREIDAFVDDQSHDRRPDPARTLSRFGPTEPFGRRDRLERDLRKLSRSLNRGYGDDSRNLPAELRRAVARREFNVFATGDEKHAELEVARVVPGGAVGVTRLNCLNCWEDLPTINRNVETRGTHNFRFPNQVQRRKSSGFIPTHRQFAEDSDSEPE